MRWLRRLFGVTETIIKIQVDGEEVSEFSLEHWIALASTFQKIPGLRDSLLADFRDVMGELSKLPADSHSERIRLAERAGCLWKFLEIPRQALAKANAIKEGMHKDLVGTSDKPMGMNTVI